MASKTSVNSTTSSFTELISLLCLIITTLFIFSVSAKSKSINIPLNGWDSQRILSRVAGIILVDQGVRVEYVEIASEKQWGALARGKLHFQVEVWENSMHGIFQQYTAIKDSGTHSAVIREEWWYPEWVQPLCPGLPDWRALNGCKHIFSRKNSDKGIYYSGPWDYDDPEMIRALKLDYKIVRLDSDKQLWDLLIKSEKDKRPILMLNWSPNWIDNRIPGSFIEFPPFSMECVTNAKYGVNKNMTHDCGNQANGWLKKATWEGLAEKYPCIYRFIENIDFTNYMVAEAAALARSKQLSEQQVAIKWLQLFSNKADKWFPKGCDVSPEITSHN